jgi:acyl-CoA thioester hydrolase
MGQPITVSLEVSGLSEDGMFFKFDHNFYNHKGENIAFCEMLGAWIDLKARKMTNLPKVLADLADKFPKSEDYKILTKEDTRANGRVPKNLKV